MNTLLRSVVAIAFLVGARAAHATCFITGLQPDDAMLPTMDVGQKFSFVASDDCVGLRFHVVGTTVTKIPRSGPDSGSKPSTYEVVLTEHEWNTIAEGEDQLTWVVTGTTSSGESTRATQTNTIDPDQHFELSVSEADAAIMGGAAANKAGASVSSAGDVDGDGNGDVLIGAPGTAYARGAAYLVMGPVSNDVDLTVATFVGEDAGDQAGTSVSGAGHVNDDEYADLLIGAPASADSDDDAGAAYLIYGPVTGRRTPGDADVELVGEVPGDQAGFSVSGAGDVTGDGIDDILVGSFWQADQPRTGAAYVVAGPVTGSTFELSHAYAKLLGPHRDDEGQGVNVTRAADLDGDGTADLVVGVDWNDEFGLAGKVFGVADVREGDMEVSGVSGSGVVMFEPESGNDAASAVSVAGDINGDGHDDILIGASDNLAAKGLNAGAAYLIYGPFLGTESLEIDLAEVPDKFEGESAGDRAGAQVSGAGDVNADGFDDILIGACRNNDGAGAAYLLLGPVSGTKELSRADLKLTGEAAHDCAGFAVSSAGDVDNDGNADVLVGAPQSSSAAGAAYVFGGATLTSLMAGSP